VLSAYGMTRAERTSDRSHTVLRPLADVGSAERARLLRDLCEEARSGLSGDAPESDVRYETSLALRYRGQSYELALPDSDDLEAAFHAAHEARFGWRLAGQEVQLVHLRARAMRVARTGAEATPAAPRSGPATATGRRSVRFGDVRADVPVFERALLGGGAAVEGPAIVDEYSGTTVVPPGTTARVVGDGALLLTRSR
jgi:N-methylhydantoinase A